MMDMNKFLNLIWLGVLLGTQGCIGDDNTCTCAGEYIPEAPVYTDPTMWVTYLNDADGTGADVFYVPSTWEYDWTTPSGEICHYADPSLASHRADMRIEMDGVADYMADGNNFYSPFYRHITLDTWATLDENLINRRYEPVSFVDVRNAFDYFIENLNGERPFVLAGFSQGGKSVVELMKVLPEELRQRMVAAYVMGYKVTPDDLSVAPWIRGAEGADDTGVTVCYNSVSAVEYVKPIVAAPNEFCINPVNWRTDALPGQLDANVTVTLDPAYKVLVVEGYDGSSLPDILGILNVGDYHGAEPWLYSECLRENFKARIRAYRGR
ncbi:MAG: DUF3089 domain-containing protein [Muribaculaceae bacterium]|nr:DUF3089 domain-containing protein [Muribaculaceae bacterium]